MAEIITHPIGPMDTEEHAMPWNKLHDTNLCGYRTDIAEQTATRRTSFLARPQLRLERREAVWGAEGEAETAQSTATARHHNGNRDHCRDDQ
jgi:hypothetical protein